MFAILVYENNQTVIMLVLQANPLGIEHLSCENVLLLQ